MFFWNERIFLLPGLPNTVSHTAFINVYAPSQIEQSLPLQESAH